MKFSLSYKSKYKQEADEIRCPVNQLGTIFPFIKENPDKRYNIIIKDEIDYNKLIEQINFVKEVAAEYTIQCNDISILHALLDEGYNAYLRFPIVDWESFDNLKSIGVSDIYIDGPLGFQTDALKMGKNHIKIRVSPCISPNANLNINANNADSFFIRPEDLKLYEDMIDIIDFKIDDQEKEDTIYQIYKRQAFNFNLEQLIEHLHIKTPNLFVREDFARHRLNCGQRCRTPQGRCHLCETQLVLTNKLLEYFEREKLEKE